MSLKFQRSLSGIVRYCTPVLDCAPHSWQVKVDLLNDVRSTGASLLRWKQSILDQTNYSHLADAQVLRRFLKNHLFAFRSFTVAINGYLMIGAEDPNSHLCPGMSLCCADSEAIKNRCDGHVW